MPMRISQIRRRLKIRRDGDRRPGDRRPGGDRRFGDDLAIYGGNAKIACTEGGVLDKIQPKFTVINGVPCMNYTVTHLSPYVVYVDTNNLTATGTLDATPKTGDPIHPKWFLVIGLAAVSGVMFLMRERKENKETAEAA